jgi:MFS family permease
LEMAILLVLLERFGKAIRSPSRDTVLSMISKDVGAGKAFGLHELLDQIGAVIGPLTVSVIMLSTNNDYHYAFGLLFIPFVLLSVFLTHTYRRIRSKTVSEAAEPITKREKLTKPFYIYTFAVLLNTLGLIPPALILFKASEILRPLRQDWIVPLIYLLIQGVDAPAALLSGYAFDKFGIKLLIVPFLLSLFPTLFAMFDSGLTILLVASVFSGLVLGMQESIYRAAVSNLAPMSARGTAYGIFHAVYGLGLLVGGGIYGFFIDIRLPLIGVIVYVAAMQSTAVASLLNACSRKRTD